MSDETAVHLTAFHGFARYQNRNGVCRVWPFSAARPVNDRVARAWWIVLLLFIMLMVGQGLRASFGIVVEPWEEKFASSRSLIGLIGSLNLLFYAIGQPLVGWLVHRYDGRRVLAAGMVVVGATIGLLPFVRSIWLVMVLYGVIGGLGFACIGQIVAAVVATRWFEQGRGTVLGIVQSGGSVGRLAVVPVVLLLVSALGWERSYSFIGVITVFILAPVLFLVIYDRSIRVENEQAGAERREPSSLKSRAEEHTRKYSSVERRTASFRELLHNHSYLALVGTFFICGYTTGGLFSTHIIPFATERGYLSVTIALALVILGILDFFGTMVSGILADRLDRRRMLQFYYGVRSLTYLGFFLLAFFPSIPSYAWIFILLAASFGVFDFATVPVTTSLAADLTTPQTFPIAISWITFSHQLGAAAGSFFPALMYDYTGSYAGAFVSATMLLVLAVIICQWISVARKGERKTPAPSMRLVKPSQSG